MKISVSEAKAKLTDLVRSAEAGDDVVLTRHGRDVARLIPIAWPAGRRQIMEDARRSAMARAQKGSSAAASQDFLYGEHGLPE